MDSCLPAGRVTGLCAGRPPAWLTHVAEGPGYICRAPNQRALNLGVKLASSVNTGRKAVAHRSRRDDARRSRRRTVRRVVLSVLGLALLVVLAAGGWLASRVLIVKDSLESAQSQLGSFKDAVGTGSVSTAAMYEDLSKNTKTAAAESRDPIWLWSEGLPVLGPNLTAVRQVSTMVNDLTKDGVQPVAIAADGLSIDSLKPVDGKVDIQPLKALPDAVAALDDAMGVAQKRAEAIDTSETLPQISGAMTQVTSLMEQASPVLKELRKVLPFLYPALGGEETRYYLLMFQNNAEERASGGNPASMALLKVKDGSIKLVEQASSGDFPIFEKFGGVGIKTFDENWEKLYGLRTTRFVTNMTWTPDFTKTAKMAQAWWERDFGRKVDGVISMDPVALSYLLGATGPIQLETGDELNRDNAVSFLLSDVYAKYPDPVQQDLVFGSAAGKIFSTITSGQGEPKNYISVMEPAIAEGRLKIWSADKKEQKVIGTYPIAGELPEDNTTETRVGVYNNDSATSKMSYYMDSTVSVTANQCNPEKPKYSVSTAVTNTLAWDAVYTLPSYVLAGNKQVQIGYDRQWVVFYGPVGSKLTSAKIGDEEVVFGDTFEVYNPGATGGWNSRPATLGTDKGRPVGMVEITIAPGETVTVNARFSGGKDASSNVTLSTTPKVRPVPAEITQAPCD